MQYWCEKYDCGDGYVHGYYYGHGYHDDGKGFYFGKGFGFSPAMLVTGVKIEEVVLNAILV